MEANFEKIYRNVREWADAHGIHVDKRRLKRGKAGAFNGVSATMNNAFAPEETVYYLVHALGSIVRWSLSQADVRAMFDELRAAKKGGERSRLDRAVERCRAFEAEASEFAVWLLADLGHAEVIPSYTNFMRADLEALTVFHQTGQTPVWRDFFSRWNKEVAVGRQQVPPFHPKPIPGFVPHKIENQEILQEQGEGP